MPLIRKPLSTPPAEPTTPGTDALASREAGRRWSAARALGSTPAEIEALGAALAHEVDPRVREAIFSGLARAAKPQALAIILPYLRVDDAHLRTAALDALRAMPAAGDALPGLLADLDPDVRLLACEMARSLGETGARLMSELLLRESEVNVCASAVDVLAEIGGQEAAPTLEACARRFPAEPFLGFAIRAAIARIGENGRPRG